MKHKKAVWLYGTLLLAALIFRLVIAGFANCGEVKTVRPDTVGYLTPAKSMIERGVYDGTRRPPGFPILAAAVFKCGGGEKALSYTLAALSALTVLAVARAGYLYGGHKAGAIAGILYAFNPTVLGNAPLLLTDTFAGLFAALQYWFFLEFYRKKKICGFFACVLA
ncbi:MAG: glycosyltransferase family 39 protein, partial [Lentisphaeria bacterium]|nr:glycosyltransferase family 39 protein [Lentisphaeria bacterium]